MMIAPLPLGVLWDMDGVLVDSGDFHYRAWAAALAREGLALSRPQFNGMFGMDNRSFLTALLGREPEPGWLGRVSEDKELAFREAIRGQVQPLPGVIAWLQRLRAAGARQAVASSAPQANVDLLIDSLGLSSYFDALVSTRDLPGKPDPAVFLEAARRLGVPAERCLVVEDSVAGVAASRRAGMACLAVTTTNPRAALSGAGLVVDSLADLSEAELQRLLSSAR
jgi:HAD superfamily hydrolase (TIGR01509 family)